MPKYLARWTRVSSTELEFEADDDELAWDHATHVGSTDYLETTAEWSPGEVELQDVDPVDEQAAFREIELRKLFEYVIEQASQGNSDFPERYAQNAMAILDGQALTYPDDDE